MRFTYIKIFPAIHTCIGIGLLVLFLSCNSKQPQHSVTPSDKENTLQTDWRCSENLSQVESVVYDRQSQVLYASNGNGFKVGTDGYLSKISVEGEMIEAKWIDSLSRPTGMAMYNGKLYVADVNVLLIIDPLAGNILQKIPEPIQQSGLNDVAISPSGEVFVTASFVHAVFKLHADQLEIWLQDENKLQWANGIIADSSRLWVAGMQLSSINLANKAVSLVSLPEEVKDFDGLAADGQGGFFMSTVESQTLWHWNSSKGTQMLGKDGQYYADLTFVPGLGQLFVARGDHALKQYFVAAYGVDDFKAR